MRSSLSTKPIDKSFLLVIFFFFGLGLVQIYSSSYVFAMEHYGDGTYFFKKQFLFTIMGAFVVVTTASLPWKFLEKSGIYLWGAALIGVLLTFVPELSVKVNGAARWLALPFGQRIEPAEILKYSYPFIVAQFLYEKYNWGAATKWIQAAIIGVPMLILLKQPDFGSFVMCFLVVAMLMFAFGLKWRYLFSLAILATPFIFYLIRYKQYRYNRVLSFLNPWSDPEQNGFQLIQSLLGYYSGGIFGKGLGQGQSKLFFLPEAHTDFTLSVLGEEMGFVSILLVALLYGFLIVRGLQITTGTQDPKKQVIALGVTLVFALSTLFNMGVSLGLLPTKGLALPFLSYGGSSMLTVCFGLGLLLNIERQGGRGPRRRRKHSHSGYRFNPYKS